MNKLTIKQINNLVTGNTLAVETISSSPDMRAFVVIAAYRLDEKGMGYRVSKFLNNNDNIFFWLRKYELKNEYIDNDWDVSEEELVNSFFVNNINSIEELESLLSNFLDDYSKLDIEWKCENPV